MNPETPSPPFRHPLPQRGRGMGEGASRFVESFLLLRDLITGLEPRNIPTDGTRFMERRFVVPLSSDLAPLLRRGARRNRDQLRFISLALHWPSSSQRKLHPWTPKPDRTSECNASIATHCSSLTMLFHFRAAGFVAPANQQSSNRWNPASRWRIAWWQGQGNLS